ncbi:MAG TPA: valine--tRNA ligase, partial [Candidatus Moranbacteria bacterium]|nr:valine--tRNA ligase [Candidatus Moranbacteria bacterium]
MKKELPKIYDPKLVEDGIYRKWEESGYFNPDKCIQDGISDEKKPYFSIVLPPPNVTGNLHMGHAAMLAIEDSMVRFSRMNGRPTLWLPGTDHAAIATQSKVEKIIYEKEGKTKHDLGKDEFLKRVRQFAQDSHDTIIKQTKKMGSSLDWTREAYTLDEQRSLAVRTAFKKMYDDGLIYRGYRVINWSVKGQST